LGRFHISRAPFASLSLGSLGARLAARFLLIFKRVRLCCGWRSGAGDRQPLASKINLFIRTVYPLSRLQQVKTPTKAGGLASHAQCFKRQQKGKFWVRAKFAFLQTNSTKNYKIFKEQETKIYFIR
jgi:hypothetical protein